MERASRVAIRAAGTLISSFGVPEPTASVRGGNPSANQRAPRRSSPWLALRHRLGVARHGFSLPNATVARALAPRDTSSTRPAARRLSSPDLRFGHDVAQTRVRHRGAHASSLSLAAHDPSADRRQQPFDRERTSRHERLRRSHGVLRARSRRRRARRAQASARVRRGAPRRSPRRVLQGGRRARLPHGAQAPREPARVRAHARGVRGRVRREGVHVPAREDGRGGDVPVERRREQDVRRDVPHPRRTARASRTSSSTPCCADRASTRSRSPSWSSSRARSTPSSTP